jgi:hypothetical protein
MTAILHKCGNTGSRISRLFEYIKTLCGALIEAWMLVIAATAGYAVLLYFLKMLWHVYIATYVGQYYLAEFPLHAQRTFNVLGRNPLEFSLKMNVLAFLVCISAGVMCKVLHMSTFLYLNRGMFGRIAICGLPLTVLVALFAKSKFGLPEWNSAYTYSLAPTLAVFSGCFNLADSLFPEIGDVLNRIEAYLRNG